MCIYILTKTLYLPRLDATKWQGERHRNLENFDSIFERSQNHKPGLIHTKRCCQIENCRARSRGPQRYLPHKSKNNSQEQRCVRHSVVRLQYHIGLSNDQKLFSSSIWVIFILGTNLLIMNWSLHVGRWKEKWWSIYEVVFKSRARLLGFCAIFSKTAITLYWEVEITSFLLGVKLDLKSFPSMCSMPHTTL